MFFSDPFMGAVREFCDAALVRFAACRSVLRQDSDGQMQVIVFLSPTAPPSPLGNAQVTFSWCPAEKLDLDTAREIASSSGNEIDWIPEDGPRLEVQLRWTASSELRFDDPDVLEELILDHLTDGLPDDPRKGDAQVQYARQRSATGRLLAGHGARDELSCVRIEFFSLSEVHARDWARHAEHVHEMVTELGGLSQEHGERCAGLFD